MKHHFRAQHSHELGCDRAWKDQDQVLGAVGRQLWVLCSSDPLSRGRVLGLAGRTSRRSFSRLPPGANQVSHCLVWDI